MTLDRTPGTGDWRTVQTREGKSLDVPRHRVAMCGRWTAGAAGVWKSPDGTNAEFSEVYSCGSVWMCPVCSPKITAGRRDELIAAVAAWRDRGGEVYLATRTFSHDKHSRELRDQMAALREALSRAKGHRRTVALLAAAGAIGAVRALEATHGEMNGWHPHTHELIFARPGEQARLLSHRTRWIRTLEKLGLAGMRDAMTRSERAEQLRYLRRHAYTVQLGDKAADYVAKFGLEPASENGGRWGPGSEMTRGHMKVGDRLGGRTPFELLRLAAEEGDKRAGMLFRDYALVFAGRAQLFWSKGLRASLVELCTAAGDEVYFAEGATAVAQAWRARARYIGRNMSDEDIAATRSAECSEFVYRFSNAEWSLVLKADARFDVLMSAMLDGAGGVRELLERLRSEPATHSGYHVADWSRFDRGRWHGHDTVGT